MPNNNSDDEADSLILCGTPLASLIPEDAKFSNKAKRPDEQIVTDEKGRQRFHGAFTGGFSAGYFNTVGTKEGFTPLAFKSSRNDRGNTGNQRPEDFMDDEDFSEFGIAPKTVSIKSDFKDKSMADNATSRKNTTIFFDDLIRPVRSTVGVRMLKKMGWREGQGIGPKIKRKLRKLKAKKVHEPGRKIYGVTLPTENEISDIEDDGVDEYDDYLVSLYDVNEFRFEIKEDLFGLGYKRLSVNEIFSGSNKLGALPVDKNSSVADFLFPGLAQKASKKRGITGQAFGVGEYEDDEDEDLYKTDTLENYDFDLDAKCQKEKKELLNKTYGFGAFENDLMVLKKFHTSLKKQDPSKVFKAPEVPTGFDLVHKFDSVLQISQTSAAESKQTDDAMNVYLKSATERGEMLGEAFIKPDSVLDLLSEKDKQFIEQQKLKQNLSQIAREVKQKSEEEKAVEEKLKKQKSEEEKVKENKLKKQKRYEQYLVYMKKNYKDPYSFVETSELTEWEKDHEKDEFFRTYQTQTKKIEEYKASMNAKFSSKNILMETSDNKIVETEIKIEDAPKEAEKKFGKSRVEYEWRPHNIVCKRFNVPNPYPDSKECGTIGSKQPSKKTHKDSSFSIFDVLTQQNKFESSNEAVDKTGNIAIVAAKVPVFANPPDLPRNEMKIEFETKAKIDKKQTKEVFEEEKVNSYKNNVYLKERPNIDIFKAIFDDEEEEDNNDENKEEKVEEIVDSDEDMNVSETLEPKTIEKPVETQGIFNTSKLESNSSIEIIPSSLSGIDYTKLNKYLSRDDFKEKINSPENDFYDSKEYEKQQKEALNKEANKEKVYGPSAPILFQKSTNCKKVIEEVIKIDSDSSNDNDFEFIEKKPGESEESSSGDSDEKNKKKKKKNKKKSKKKSKKKK